ncbi:MAG: ribonuclease III [Pelagibacteraceae bacterium]|jgi:ribonuclease III|nr:ribonuclease III [Pseudomonadota bacterium]
MTDTLNKLEQLIGVKFKDKELLKKSLIHKSHNNSDNNEKLEFLGDRVLGLSLAKTLLKIYPNEKEGIIDKKFANLVNKKTCLQIAKKLDLGNFIQTGNSYKKLNKSEDKILSDGLEALLGAIYLDQGMSVVEKFILNNWKEHLDKSSVTEIDAKTQLQEYSLKKYKTLPVYTIKKQSGPHHNPIFNVEVQIKDSKKFFAKGTSKKNAQQNAAKKLLLDLKL